jgi:choline kinase
MAVTRAILLLAGKGNRMGELTSQIPKCLLDVVGRPILARALETLARAGVSEIVAVVGYREEAIHAFLASSPWGDRVTCISNREFARTNTVYSLWLAKQYLNAPAFVIEGDIVFGSDVMSRIAGLREDASVWCGIPVSPDNCTGIVLAADDTSGVSEIALLSAPEPAPRRYGFKCAGIQRLTAGLAADLRTTLETWVAAGQERVFADLALAAAMSAHSVRLCNLTGLPWCEVDSPEDLARSQTIFGGPASARSLTSTTSS